MLKSTSPTTVEDLTLAKNIAAISFIFTFRYTAHQATYTLSYGEPSSSEYDHSASALECLGPNPPQTIGASQSRTRKLLLSRHNIT